MTTLEECKAARPTWAWTQKRGDAGFDVGVPGGGNRGGRAFVRVWLGDNGWTASQWESDDALRPPKPTPWDAVEQELRHRRASAKWTVDEAKAAQEAAERLGLKTVMGKGGRQVITPDKLLLLPRELTACQIAHGIRPKETIKDYAKKLLMFAEQMEAFYGKNGHCIAADDAQRNTLLAAMLRGEA
jgi:hypothetical protein